MASLIINNHEIIENTISDKITIEDKTLKIPNNTIIKDPINIKLIKDNNEELNFHIGSGSEVTILLEITDESKNKANYNINLTAGDNSNVKYLLIASLNSEDGLLEHDFNILKDANVKVLAGLVGNVLTTKLIANLIGEGGTVDVKSVAVSSDNHDQTVDVYLHHKAKNTYGNMVNVGIANKKGRVILNGIEKIEQGMKNSEVFQTLRGIITSDDAVIEVNPILLIDEYDLKAAGHAATVGKLDEEMLFYLQSRGLTKEVAEKLIINGFLEPILKEIDNEDMKERFEKLVNSRIWLIWTIEISFHFLNIIKIQYI